MIGKTNSSAGGEANKTSTIVVHAPAGSEFTMWSTQATGRNLAKLPYICGNAGVSNGISYSVNTDGSVTLNGTASNWPGIRLRNDISPGNYIIGKNRYDNGRVTSSMHIDDTFYDAITGSTYIEYRNGSVLREEGLFINVFPETSLENFTFRPMLYKAVNKQIFAAEENGTWTFKGCKPGWYYITIRKDGQVATKTIAIDFDKSNLIYDVTMTYFAAYITVNYPAGSICTCANGNTTLTAPDTSGNVVFTVDSPSNWTVTITDGGKMRSAFVEPLADNQNKIINIAFEVHFFISGTGQITPFEYSGQKNAHLAIESSRLHLWSDYADFSYGGVMTSNHIDLTYIDTLYYDVEGVRTSNYTSVAVKNVDDGYNDNGVVSANITYGRKTIALDVSALKGMYRIWARIARYEDIVIYNIWGV